MDYWSRLIISLTIGLGAAFGLTHFFGNLLVWIILCPAIAIATESSLRTIKNVGPSPNPVLDKVQDKENVPADLSIPKPPKPKF